MEKKVFKEILPKKKKKIFFHKIYQKYNKKWNNIKPMSRCFINVYNKPLKKNKYTRYEYKHPINTIF